MRVGIVDHYGWAVAVTADDQHRVVDRRRLELIEPGLPAAPIHHHGGAHRLHGGQPRTDVELAALVAEVRAAAERATAAALDHLATELDAPVAAVALRSWPASFPTDIAVLRRPPYESRADPVMYRRVLADAATVRGWTVHQYDARDVERRAAAVLGEAADEVLHGPRARLGPPWGADQRTALAATIVTR